MKIVYFLLPFVILVAKSLAVPQRPNYLTNEDFERGRSLPTVNPNATFLNRYDSPCERKFSKPLLFRALQPSTNVVQEPKRSKRNAYIFDVFQWPNAVVPYTLDSRFDNAQRATIAGAINQYHTKTCVRFVNKRATDVDYLQIVLDDTVCGSSTFCRQGGGQFSKIGSTCIKQGIEIVTHELGHSLCFSHETDRSDRDNYISFNTAKCQPYPKNTVSDSTNLDLLYDYLSVQHYEPPFVDGCIIPKLPGVTKCGSGGGLSVLDAEKINAYYRCGGCYSYRFRPISLITNNDILVSGGWDTSGATLYPCRGYYNGDIIVGKAFVSTKTCWVPYGGAERVLTSNFEVLTNPKNVNINWVKRPADGSTPTNAIPGGRTATRETLYIGRFTKEFNGKTTTLIGKVYNKFCYVSYGGVEFKSDDYDFLVCN